MKQRLKLELKQKQTVRQELDMVDMQSVCESAHARAASLVEKHNGNIKEIKKEILTIKVPEGIEDTEDFNYREEILWAAKWLIPTFNNTVPAT